MPKFSDSSAWTWSTLVRILRRAREWIISQKGLETADQLIPEYDLQTLEAKVQDEASEDQSGQALPAFAGFDDWIEIFQGGRQMDSHGRTHDGDALIDAAITKFDSTRHEPPLVLGHPSDNAPAYGWVEGLRKAARDGLAVLEAKFKQVVPGLEQAVKDGLFKKRSAAFYSDGTLRHVGLLGAMPPAVKGLADIGFAAGDAVQFVFTTKGESFMDPSKQFTQADLDAAACAAEEKAKAAMAAEFAEQQARMVRENKANEIKTELQKRVAAGRVPPALLDLGLPEFMAGLDPVTEFQFAEGKKSTGAGFMFSLLDKLDTLGLFKEIATKERGAPGAGSAEADAALGKSIAAKVAGAEVRK